MLSQLSQIPSELLRKIKEPIIGYCSKHNMPKLPVIYGVVKEASGPEFSPTKQAIILSPRLS